jgi:hypothetical protein
MATYMRPGYNILFSLPHERFCYLQLIKLDHESNLISSQPFKSAFLVWMDNLTNAIRT